MYVFVYGTLKSNNGNNTLLKEDIYLGEGITDEKFVMTNCGFPFVIHPEWADAHEATHIKGEIYEIHGTTLPNLDMLEGYRGKGQDNFYNRELHSVTGADGQKYEAYIYIHNSSEGDRVDDVSEDSYLELCRTEEFMDKKVYVY